MYRRSNMFFTLSFIHLVSSMLVSYYIYVNRLLFENEDSIIFCKQSVSFLCTVCEDYSAFGFFLALRLLFTFQSDPQDRIVPTAPMLTLQSASSITGRARLRLDSWGIVIHKHIDKAKDHAAHGLSLSSTPCFKRDLGLTMG